MEVVHCPLECVEFVEYRREVEVLAGLPVVLLDGLPMWFHGEAVIQRDDTLGEQAGECDGLDGGIDTEMNDG